MAEEETETNEAEWYEKAYNIDIRKAQYLVA